MTEALSARPISGTRPTDEGVAEAHDLTEWLCLAATPTFAIMALLTGLGGGDWTRSVRLLKPRR